MNTKAWLTPKPCDSPSDCCCMMDPAWLAQQQEGAIHEEGQLMGALAMRLYKHLYIALYKTCTG